MSNTAASSVVLVAIAVMLTAAADQPPAVKYCVLDQVMEEHLHRMMSDSLDDAFKEHIKHLFDIWVKDQAESPARAINGAALGVNAYVRAQRNLSDWHPPRCPEAK
jgi:hypothetical protein